MPTKTKRKNELSKLLAINPTSVGKLLRYDANVSTVARKLIMWIPVFNHNFKYKQTQTLEFGGCG